MDPLVLTMSIAQTSRAPIHVESEFSHYSCFPSNTRLNNLHCALALSARKPGAASTSRVAPTPKRRISSHPDILLNVLHTQPGVPPAPLPIHIRSIISRSYNCNHLTRELAGGALVEFDSRTELAGVERETLDERGGEGDREAGGFAV